jgi:hypothetical protein
LTLFRKLATAVCGFVPYDADLKMRSWHRDYEYITTDTENRIKILWAHVSEKFLRPLLVELSRADTDYTAMLSSTSYTQVEKDAALKHLQDLEMRMLKWQTFKVTHVNKLKSLPWPTETNIKTPSEVKGNDDFSLSMKYFDQPGYTEGSGFQILPGIVMTANHVVDGKFSKVSFEWHELTVHFYQHLKKDGSGRIPVNKTAQPTSNSTHKIKRFVIKSWFA